MGNEPVIVVGTGDYTFELDSQSEEINQQIILRQANSQTISSRECAETLKDIKYQQAIICVDVANNRTGYDGDSGN